MHTGIADGVKRGVSDFVDAHWREEGGGADGDDPGGWADRRAPGYIRVRALKSEAFL